MRPSLLPLMPLLGVLLAACAHPADPLPSNVDEDLDRHEADAFCEKWRTLGTSANPAAPLQRAKLALQDASVPLPEGACLTREQLAAEGLRSAETAVQSFPADREAWLVLGECRTRFGGDRRGAADAVCRAADLSTPDRALLGRCGDLLRDTGRLDEAIVRWRAALDQPGNELDGYHLLDKLSAAGAVDAVFLETLPETLVSGWAEWKRNLAQAERQKALEEAQSGRHDDGSTSRRSSTDEFNERVREKMREAREEEQADP